MKDQHSTEIQWPTFIIPIINLVDKSKSFGLAYTDYINLMLFEIHLKFDTLPRL